MLVNSLKDKLEKVILRQSVVLWFLKVWQWASHSLYFQHHNPDPVSNSSSSFTWCFMFSHLALFCTASKGRCRIQSTVRWCALCVTSYRLSNASERSLTFRISPDLHSFSPETFIYFLLFNLKIIIAFFLMPMIGTVVHISRSWRKPHVSEVVTRHETRIGHAWWYRSALNTGAQRQRLYSEALSKKKKKK